MTGAHVSLFSGIGGIDLGFQRAGLAPDLQVEWDTACQAVLAHHWPSVPKLADVQKVAADEITSLVGSVHVLSGGFPCQDVSMAGRRAGMASGTRSGLYREIVRLANALDPDWLVIENVAGLLSADDGSGFAMVLGDLTGWEPATPVRTGWGNSGVCIGPIRSAAWRVLDAQYFGVPQRRRRVFIVCHPRDRIAPASVLIECEGMSGYPRALGTTWQKAARSAAGNAGISRTFGVDTAPPLLSGAGGLRTTDIDGATFVAVQHGYGQWAEAEQAGPLAARDWKSANTLAFHVTQDPISGHVMPALGEDSTAGVLTAPQGIDLYNQAIDGDLTHTVMAGGTPHLLEVANIRRLTPRECERLQGFPDDWTLVSGTSDTARYRQLGNAVCVNVAEWVAARIAEYERG